MGILSFEIIFLVAPHIAIGYFEAPSFLRISEGTKFNDTPPSPIDFSTIEAICFCVSLDLFILQM